MGLHKARHNRNTYPRITNTSTYRSRGPNALNLAHYFEKDGRFFDLSTTVIPPNAYIAVTIRTGSTVYYKVESSINDISIVCDIYKDAPTPFQMNRETPDAAITYYKSTTANQNQETTSSQKQYTFGLAFGAMLMACAMIPMRSNKAS